MTAPVVAAPARPASPFKGLTPYTEEDAAFFFGRDEEIEVAIANLEARRLTLLYGESGVGKSSLLRAGVVHRLRESARRNLEEIGTPEFVPVYFATWRDDPLAALLDEIRRSVSAVIGEPAHETPPSGRLDEALELWSTQAAADILVVLDQFEEYFVYHSLDRGEGTFAGELPRAVNSAGLRARFLLAIREDALAKLDRFKREIPTLFGTYLRLKHLDRGSAREAITRPIEEYNRLATTDDERVEIEPALVEAVLDQVTAGRVVLEQAAQGLAGGDGVAAGEERIETPYLQLVITRLWNEEMRRSSRLLRLSTMHELGGAETIVRTHLDEKLGALPPDVQDVVVDLFHYLVTPTGTKIAHAVPDLAAYTGRSEPEVADVLEQLSRGEVRIIRPVAAPPGQGGPPRYEIFHDVLGPAVLDWRTRHVHGRLEQQKDQAEKLAHKERRRARIYRALAVAAFALLLAATSVFAVVQTQRAKDAMRRSESRLFAAESRDALDISLDTAILRAIEADASADTFEARSALLAVVRRSAGLRGFLHFPSAVEAMAIDPVGGKLAIALRNGTLAVRDRNGRPLATLHRKPGSLSEVAFGPGGRVLAVLHEGTALLLSLRGQGQSVGPPALREIRMLQAPGGRLGRLAWSSDGRWLAGMGTAEIFGQVTVWDLRGRSRVPQRSFPARGSALAFSPTEPSLLAFEGRYGAAIFDVRRGRTVPRLPRSGGALVAIAFSPDGKMLATASSAKKVVRLLRLDGNPKSRRLAGHTAPVSTIAFAPDGRTLATGGEDQKVILWDVRKARPIGEPLRGHSNFVTSLAFDRQRETLAVAALDGKVSLWNVAERARLGGRIEVDGASLTDVAFSADGNRVVALTSDGRVLIPRVQRVARAGPPLDLDAYSASALAVSPTGRWLAFAGRYGVEFRDLHGAKPKGRLPPAVRAAEVTDIAFSRDGMLAAATYEGRILVWKPGGRALSAKLGPRTGDRDSSLEAIAFSPDGMLVAAGYWNFSGEGSVVLWLVSREPGSPSRARAITMPGGHLRPVLAVAFSPDGKTVASAGRDFTIKLWSVEERALLGTMFGHAGFVRGLAFSPDGSTLASSSEDMTVRLWDVKERRPLGEPLAVGAKVHAVAFGPEESGTGRGMLAAASDDGELSVWDASFWSLGTQGDLDALHRRLCSVAGGDLSPKARTEQFTADLREACGWT